MVKKICIFSNVNQYESKRHFSIKLAEALKRKGVDALHINDKDISSGDDFVKRMKIFKPDLTCSFNRSTPKDDGTFFWDNMQMPHLSILVDPSYYDMNILNSPYSIISCVDRFDLVKIETKDFDRVFFFPHGVERELHTDPASERPYDIVMIGTCYDPDTLKDFWQKNAPPIFRKIIEEAIEIVLSEPATHFEEATQRTLKANKVPFDAPLASSLPYFVDYYSRGIDRLQLVRSIRGAKVHVFGDPCWRNLLPAKGWDYYLAKDSNVVLHPAVFYPDAIEIMKKSKICLNSMPMFKAGSHERIFTALACGCAVVTSESTYIREHFNGPAQILYYEYPRLDELNDRVTDLLNHPKKRIEMVLKAQEEVFKNHTWDVRAGQLIEALPYSLEKIGHFEKNLKHVRKDKRLPHY